MPRSETILSVLISCPSDLSDERRRVVDVIDKINREWAKSSGIRLEAVTWTDNAHSSMGSDPQSVLNEQLGDCDIFIGMMWHRFGTDTPRTGSGTVEEFLAARDQYLNGRGTGVSFYFKTTPIPPDEIDATQLGSVQEFKRSMSSYGQLYREFTDLQSLEDLVRLQLSADVRKDGSLAAHEQGAPEEKDHVTVGEVSAAHGEDEDQEEEEGIFDLLAATNDRFDEVSQIVERLAGGMNTLTERTNGATSELNAILKGPVPTADARPILRVFGRVADDMDSFSARIDGELPLYRQAFRSGIDATIEATTLSLRHMPGEAAQARKAETNQGLVKLHENLASAIEALTGFRDSVANQPSSLSKKMNKASRKLVASLDRLLAEWSDNVAYLANLLK